MKSKALWGCGVACALALTGTVRADGFRNPPEDAATLGKAGVRTVWTEDAGAAAHNVANLTSLEAIDAKASLTLGYSSAEFKSAAGTVEMEEPWKVLPNLFLGIPLDNQGLAAGLALTTPYGQSSVWEREGVFAAGAAPYRAEMSTVDLQPSIAKRFDRVSVGVGLDLIWSDLLLKQSIQHPLLGNTTLKGEGDGGAVSGHAGLRWDVDDRQAVGLTWRAPFSVEYDGDSSVSGAPSDSDFGTTIDFPQTVAAGYGLKVDEQLRVEFQVEWLQHSAYNRSDIEAGGAVTPLHNDWQDTWTFGVGADWKASEKTTWRAGYSYLESPIPDATYVPTIPDSDRHVLAVGVGMQAYGGEWELAYAYSLLDDRDISDNQNPALNGSYEYAPHLLSVSYRHAF